MQEPLHLSFPYDWSNSEIGDEALILAVLERGIFEDLCKACHHYGVARLRQLMSDAPHLATQSSLIRKLHNIERGAQHAVFEKPL